MLQRTDRTLPADDSDKNHSEPFIVAQGRVHTFDSLECAVHKAAPACEHCGVSIVGHGLEKSGRMFCCGYCAERAGVKELRDRA